MGAYWDVEKQCKRLLLTVKSHNMCAWGSSFQWCMGIIGGSTKANRPTCNRRCRGRRLLDATCGIIEEKNHGWALIRAWALNRDNTVTVNFFWQMVVKSLYIKIKMMYNLLEMAANYFWNIMKPKINLSPCNSDNFCGCIISRLTNFEQICLFLFES